MAVVLFDLEETLIDSWESGLLLPGNIEKVKRFVHGTWNWDCPSPLLNPTFGLMSWAVWDKRDMDRFNRDFREPLEQALELKFDESLLWSMDDWVRNAVLSGRRFTREDLFDLGKEDVLFRCTRHPLFVGQTTFLVDDAVEHYFTFNSMKTKTVVQMLNIKEM